MEAALRNLPGCSCYFDDTTIKATSYERLLEYVSEYFDLCQRRGISLAAKKTTIGLQSITALGHTVSAQGITTDPSKIDVLKQMKVPSNPKELRTFLCTAGYYACMIPSFAILARHLQFMLRADAVWTWTPLHQKSYATIIDHLTSAPVLHKFVDGMKLELVTDASKLAIAAVLQHRDADGNPHPIAFAGRACNRAEMNYNTHDLEALAVAYGILKFKVYLWRRHFTVFTDHQALLNFHNGTKTGRTERLSLFLQDYDFEVKHIKGSDNVVADHISRMMNDARNLEQHHESQASDDSTDAEVIAALGTTAELPAYSVAGTAVDDLAMRQRWLAAQAADEFCKSTISHMNHAGVTAINGFQLVNEILMHHEIQSNTRRIVVPRSLVPEVLALCHDSPSAGHLGLQKTIHRVSREFFWQNWKKDVKSHVDGCRSCKVNKHGKPSATNLPTLHVVSDGPGDLVAMDIQGPLSLTCNKNQYILVIQDLFTKYTIAVPLADTKSSTVARAYIQHWIQYFGQPHRILNDNGTNFVSDLFRELHVLLGSAATTSSPYHPQTNGAVERWNKTVKTMLSHFVNALGNDWDQYLALATQAYNSTVHATTHETPFFLFTGRQPPPMRLYNLGVDAEVPWCAQAQRARRIALQAAYDQLVMRNDNANYDARIFNMHHRHQPHPIGSAVYVFEAAPPPGINRKVYKRWRPGFVVTHQSGPLSYVVEHTKSGALFRVHADRILAVPPAHVLDPITGIDLPDDLGGEDEPNISLSDGNDQPEGAEANASQNDVEVAHEMLADAPSPAPAAQRKSMRKIKPKRPWSPASEGERDRMSRALDQ